jgi:hypothetical protein
MRTRLRQGREQFRLTAVTGVWRASSYQTGFWLLFVRGRSSVMTILKVSYKCCILVTYNVTTGSSLLPKQTYATCIKLVELGSFPILYDLHFYCLIRFDILKILYYVVIYYMQACINELCDRYVNVSSLLFKIITYHCYASTIEI